jgi:hypothetical protein
MTSDSAINSIEQAVRAVVRAVGLRHAGTPQDGLADLDAACVALTGQAPGALVDQPLSSLLDGLRQGQRLDGLRLTTLAHVLSEWGAALESAGEGQASSTYERALRLYDEAAQAGVDPASQATIDAQVAWIMERLHPGSRA